MQQMTFSTDLVNTLSEVVRELPPSFNIELLRIDNCNMQGYEPCRQRLVDVDSSVHLDLYFQLRHILRDKRGG